MKRDKNIIQEAAQTLIQPAYGKTTTTTTNLTASFPGQPG